MEKTETPQLEPCCQDESNRGEPEKVDGRDDLTFTRCKCGRRHFEMTVDPATIGVVFK
jgi:hypothetical protein